MPWPIESYTDFGDGIERRMASNNPDFPMTAFWDAVNMVYNRESTEPETMMGLARLGTSTIGGYVTGLFDYADGTALIATASDGKIWTYSTDWAAVASGARKSGNSTSTTVRWTGGMYYGATTVANLLILCNGVDAPIKYETSTGATALGGSPPSTGNFPTAFVGRLWLAAGDVLYYSAAGNCEDWTTNGGSILIERGTGNITGLTTFAGNMLIFKHDKIYLMPTTSSLLATAIRPVSGTIGCVSHWTIREVVTSSRSLLIFLSDYGLRALVPTSSTGGLYTPDISSPIQEIIDRRYTLTQTTMWGVYNERRGEYYFQYGTGSSVPSEGVICNLARRNGSPRFTRNNLSGLTAGTIYNLSSAKVQVVGDSSGFVYQWHSGYSRNGSPYTSRLYTGALTQGRTDYMKQYGRLYLDVETSGSYPVTVRTNLGRYGLPTPSGNVSQPAEFGVEDGWGTGEWAVAQWGGSGVRGSHIRLDKVSRGSFLRVILETTGPSHPFKLNGMKVESMLTANSPRA